MCRFVTFSVSRRARRTSPFASSRSWRQSCGPKSSISFRHRAPEKSPGAGRRRTPDSGRSSPLFWEGAPAEFGEIRRPSRKAQRRCCARFCFGTRYATWGDGAPNGDSRGQCRVGLLHRLWCGFSGFGARRSGAHFGRDPTPSKCSCAAAAPCRPAFGCPLVVGSM